MSKQYDLLLRVLIIGDSGVGKTCLLCRLPPTNGCMPLLVRVHGPVEVLTSFLSLLGYVDDQFYPSYAATIGIDFKVKNLTVNGRRIRVQIWDTAGQERFETITKQYYRRAQGIVLVYDMANGASFRHLTKWLTFIRQHAKDNVEITVIGNKTDLDEWRQVDCTEGIEFAEKNGFGFFETSAYMEADSLDGVFGDLVERIMVNQAEDLARQRVDTYPSSESEDERGEFRLGEASGSGESKCCSS